MDKGFYPFNVQGLDPVFESEQNIVNQSVIDSNRHEICKQLLHITEGSIFLGKIDLIVSLKRPQIKFLHTFHSGT